MKRIQSEHKARHDKYKAIHETQIQTEMERDRKKQEEVMRQMHLRQVEKQALWREERNRFS